MKKINVIQIKPWDREKYPGLFTKTELKQQKLMPGPNVKPRAIVERPLQYGGNYDLYTIEKTVPFRKTAKQKKQEAVAKKLNRERKKSKALREEKLQQMAAFFEGAVAMEKVYEVVVIDFETTGFSRSDDEILQVSIIDQDGNVLINQLCRPIVKQEWKDAARVHGISPAMVKKMPSFLDIAVEVGKILLSAKEVIAYNEAFEAGFLEANGIAQDRICWGPDPMIEYAYRHNNGRYAKLSHAAAEYGYDFRAHDALEDVRATLFLYLQLQKEQNESEVSQYHDREDMAN